MHDSWFDKVRNGQACSLLLETLFIHTECGRDQWDFNTGTAHHAPPPSSFLLCTSRNRKRGVVLRQSLILPRFISQPLLAGLKHPRKVSGIPVMNGTLVSSSVWELFRANGWESGTRLQFFFLLLLLSFSFLFFFCVVLFCFWRKGFSVYLGPS